MSTGEEVAAPEALTDAVVVARIAAGDRLAEAEFVRKYERGVRVLVHRHCRPNDPVVDDLTQDVLTRVLERLRAGAIRDAVALPAYIQTTVVYATSAEYRNRRPAETVAAVEDIAGGEDPPAQLSSEELGRLLKSLLGQLPIARDREVLIRFYLDEMDKEQVCEQLGIDASHFHRVIHRARERFRLLLLQVGIQGAA